MSKDELRPSDWDSYIGQENLKRRLRIHATAALKGNRALEPTLLAAGAGMGKTSLASLIADTLFEELTIVNMPLTATQLASTIRMLDGGVLVFDEIHRATKGMQEDLLPLLEFGYLDQGGRKIYSPYTSFIGCTTEPENLIEPLRDRFVIKPTYDEYSPEEMQRILEGMVAKVWDERLSPDCLATLSEAALGTPRRCRQFALAVRDLSSIGEEVTAESVLDLCDISKDGLTRDHLKYLRTLGALGGAKGLDVIVNLMGVTKKQVTQIEKTLLLGEYVTIHNSRELTRKGVLRLREEDS